MVREELLKELENHKGLPVSGGELARRLSVSRTAVWKAVDALREEGYDIRSIPQKGYMLEENSDILSAFRIEQVCDLHLFDLYVHKSVSSTNTWAMEQMIHRENEGFLCVVSEEQTAGKGVNGASFLSPKYKGIYLTLAKKMRVDGDRVPAVYDAVFAVVLKTLEQETGLRMEREGPASIRCCGEKIGGILMETMGEYPSGVCTGAAMGIGLNVYDEIQPSLYSLTGKYFNRSDLIGKLLPPLAEIMM